MKKYILTALTAIATMSVQAQNPMLTTFTVEYTKANGNDTIVEVSKVGDNSFKFIGGKGKWYVFDDETGTNTVREESNKDLFINIADISGDAVWIRTVNSSGVDFKQIGYCVSKSPNTKVTSNIVEPYDNRDEYWNFFFELDKQSVYTLSLTEENRKNGMKLISAKLEGLDYITTYYVRPYIILNNDEVMYGGEKTITTLKTVSAALRGETEIGGGYYKLDNGVVIIGDAMEKFWSNYEGAADYVIQGVKRDLDRFITDGIAAQLKELAYKTITCVDGELYLVKELPEDLVKSFIEYYNSDVTFSVVDNLNLDTNDLGKVLYTKNVGVIDTVSCDPALGVPYDTYVTYQPVSSAANPSIAFDVPKYLKAGTYSIYAVIVHPDPVNDPRPNRFYTYIYEAGTDTTSKNYGNYTTRGDRLTAPEGSGEGNYYITDISKMVDTLYIGDYTFKGAEKCMIQFFTQVTSRLRETYNRTMSVSQICIKRVEESEEQNTENQ